MTKLYSLAENGECAIEFMNVHKNTIACWKTEKRGLILLPDGEK